MFSLGKLISNAIPSFPDMIAATVVEGASSVIRKVSEDKIPEVVKDLIPQVEQNRGELQDIVHDIAQRTPRFGAEWNAWSVAMLTGGTNPLTGQPYPQTAENRQINAISMQLRVYGEERREEFRQWLKDLVMGDPVRREIVIEQLTDDRTYRRIMAVGDAVLTPVNDSLQQLTHTVATRRPGWLRR